MGSFAHPRTNKKDRPNNILGHVININPKTNTYACPIITIHTYELHTYLKAYIDKPVEVHNFSMEKYVTLHSFATYAEISVSRYINKIGPFPRICTPA